MLVLLLLGSTASVQPIDLFKQKKISCVPSTEKSGRDSSSGGSSRMNRSIPATPNRYAQPQSIPAVPSDTWWLGTAGIYFAVGHIR